MTAIPHYTRWPAVEGYCWPISVTAGDEVPVQVASRAASFSVVVRLVRDGPTEMWRREGLSAGDHGVGATAVADGCDWPTAFGIQTGSDWPSGYYEVRFIADSVEGPAAVSEAFFVIRPSPARPTGNPLLVLSTNTWNAYNQWGGRCLYSGAHRVAFTRPLERGYLRRPAAPFETDYDGRLAATDGDPEHRRVVAYQHRFDYPLWTSSAGWHNWERRFVRWASSIGSTIDVAVNADLEFHPEVLDGAPLLLSVGHDEYWSWGMRDRVDRFVTGGGNWVILSGNTCFWQVRFEDGGRSMVCHKGRARTDDPVISGDDVSRLTSIWSDPLIGRPETLTTGLTFTRGGYHRIGGAVPGGDGGFVVHRPEHWVFDGTGLRDDRSFGTTDGIVGYEVDGCAFEWSGGRPVPTGVDGAPADLSILATAPARLISITAERCEAPVAIWGSVVPPGDLEFVAGVLFGDDRSEHVTRIGEGHAVFAVFGSTGGTVVNAGTTDWAYGLDTDPLVQQITANLLERLG